MKPSEWCDKRAAALLKVTLEQYPNSGPTVALAALIRAIMEYLDKQESATPDESGVKD